MIVGTVVWVPLASEMDLSGLLAFEVDLVPLIESSVDAERAQLDLGLSNHVVLANIIVHHFDSQVIADVLHVDVKVLIPLGFFAGFFLDRGLESLLSDFNYAVRVHLVGIGVAGEAAFNDGELKGA